jgi:signal peptidase I
MPRKGSLLREFPILVIVALAVSLLIKTFVVQFFYIPSGSMENTLQIQDRVAVNKIPFISHSIHRGDVIVFRDPDNWLPIATEPVSNKVVTALKDGLVTVGVLPNPAKQYLVKRVIGVAGDHVICCAKDKTLIINGKKTSEPYIFKGNNPSDMDFNVTVPEWEITAVHLQTLAITKMMSIMEWFPHQKLPVASTRLSGPSSMQALLDRTIQSLSNY